MGEPGSERETRALRDAADELAAEANRAMDRAQGYMDVMRGIPMYTALYSGLGYMIDGLARAVERYETAKVGE